MRHKMHAIIAALLGSLAVSSGLAAQENASKIKVSGEPLKAEQVAVYRAVLEDYSKDSRVILNLANETEPLEVSGPFSDNGCFAGLSLEIAENSAMDVHQLDAAVTSNLRIVLVDRDRQLEKIKQGDPQNLVKKSIDDRQKVTEKQLDAAVEDALSNGLFTLSEIAFDKEHLHAVMTYSFTCGMLCGHGNPLVLKKVSGKWKVSKRCAGWIS